MATLRVCSLLTSHIFALLLSPLLFAGLSDGAQQCIYSRQQAGICLSENREPALYTQDFGDCQGDSLIKVTQFNGAYYQDNMTVTWNLRGETSLKNDSVMLYISVYAYGRNRIGLTVDPCFANINSLCPLNASVPTEASGIIQVSPMDVADIPSIATSIPDFEGQAILRIFSNSTQSQIACYSAVLTNGASFSHPAAVSSILGVFTFIALCGSLAVALYGSDMSSIRNHYAHSLSVLVVFSVYHHIYFTGALSMNWSSALVAFWANYAWSAGMIYSESMQRSINHLLGDNKGNISTVGSAALGTSYHLLGGGFNISQLYRRDGLYLEGNTTLALSNMEGSARLLARGANANESNYYSWYGSAVIPGLPLPGNYSSFAGTLAQARIPASNAFMTGFLWFLILLAVVALVILTLKLLIEVLDRFKLLTTDRFLVFRAHWLRYISFAMLRVFFAALYMVTFLALFQFTVGGSAGMMAIAGVVLSIFLTGTSGAVTYALYDRLKVGNFSIRKERLLLKREKVLFGLPWFKIQRESKLDPVGKATEFGNWISLWWIQYVESTKRPSVHEDEDYLCKFGWLFARFRRTRWFFFAIWSLYEFVRACFFGAAAGHPLIQVFGILAVESVAFVAIVWMRPFEAARLNTLMVYLLGFSKVSTVALSAAFDPRFNLDRVTTTIIGIVIICIQGILTILLLISISIGAITSFMSLTRYQKEDKSRLPSWQRMRSKYLVHVEEAASDLPPPVPIPEGPKEPSFYVHSVQRLPKIEDEALVNLDISEESSQNGEQTAASCPHRRSSSRSSLPFGARPSRAIWSSRDFELWHEENKYNDNLLRAGSPRSSRLPPNLMRDDAASLRKLAIIQRAKSRSASLAIPRHESPVTTALTRNNPAFSASRLHGDDLEDVREE
ncbi:Transient receptor potential (TRP) ion channel domain containing protein [Elaphomyces granulatus]